MRSSLLLLIAAVIAGSLYAQNAVLVKTINISGSGAGPRMRMGDLNSDGRLDIAAVAVGLGYVVMRPYVTEDVAEPELRIHGSHEGEYPHHREYHNDGNQVLQEREVCCGQLG